MSKKERNEIVDKLLHLEEVVPGESMLKISESLTEKLEKPSPRRLSRVHRSVVEAARQLQEARKSIERYATFQSKMDLMTFEERQAAHVLRHIICQLPGIMLPNSILRKILEEMKLPPEPDPATKLRNKVFNPIVARVSEVLRDWADNSPTPSIRKLIKRKKKRKADSDEESEYEYEDFGTSRTSARVAASAATGADASVAATDMSAATAAI